MEAPLFSQIPTAVLKRVQDADYQKRRKLIDSAKINDEYIFSNEQLQEENISSEVTSSFPKNKSKKAKSDAVPSNFVKPSRTLLRTFSWREKETREVSTQTDPEPELEVDLEPVKIEQGTQTIETCTTYEQYRNRIEAESLSVGYKPVYSIPAFQGSGPPLKIGLTLPKGKKRKVFYPDEEKDD